MGSMKKQLTFISILMVIIIAALTLGGLQLFGRGKAKPSEWFGKEKKTQSEQTSPETKVSATSGALLATSDSDLLKTYTNTGKSFFTANFNTWYKTAAPGLQHWDYTVKSSIECTNTSCTMSNQNIIFSFKLYVEDEDEFAYTYVGIDPNLSMGIKYNSQQITEVPACKFTHTHSSSTKIDNVIMNITDSKFTLSVENILTHSTDIIYTCSKGSSVYTKFHNLLLAGGYWRLTYTSGGTGAKTINPGKYAITETMVLDSRVPASLPADPTKEGHTFAGWYYGSECSGSCQAYDGAPIYEDTALHAHFNINRYTVTYDVAGGTPIESEVLNWNTVASAPTPIRIGYNFKGWALADGSIYNNSPIKQNTTLTARWEIKIFTVTFYVDGDNGEEAYATLEVPYGSTLAEAMEEAEISSYKAMTTEGVRLSKQNTTITENTQVLVEELTGWEKYGDFVGRNKWFTWVIVGVIGALALTAAISITVAVKRK